MHFLVALSFKLIRMAWDTNACAQDKPVGLPNHKAGGQWADSGRLAGGERFVGGKENGPGLIEHTRGR